MADEYDAIRMKAAHVGLFETPILHGRLAGAEGLTDTLARTIRARRDADPGIGRSNVGGWHSATDMLAWAARRRSSWPIWRSAASSGSPASRVATSARCPGP